MSVLKLLFDKYPDVDVRVLEEHLQRASQGPFYHAEFDTDTGPGTVYRSESTTSGLCHAATDSYQPLTVQSVGEGMDTSRSPCHGLLIRVMFSARSEPGDAIPRT